MNISGSIPVTDSRSSIAGNVGRWVVWLLWQCIRLPLFLLLITLEPVVTFVLGSLALLGVLTALFWKFFGPSHFPFATVVGISLCFEFGLILYHKLLHLLGR